jgi:hypothetical protein
VIAAAVDCQAIVALIHRIVTSLSIGGNGVTRLRIALISFRLAAATLGLAAICVGPMQALAKAKHHKAAPPAASAKPAATDASDTANEPASKDKSPPNNAATDAGDETEVPASEAATVNAPVTWPATDIAIAKARCAVILKRINAVAIEEAPIKEGACGAPAPIQLISIGNKPQISISPPAILTCDMAEALSTWVENDLQPLARQHLGAEIIKIETMSSYSCRNAYGRKHGRLSEHGVANALDIRGFVTASAKTAYVLEDWGTPQREILARIAAAKAAAERMAADKAAAEKAMQTNQLAAKSKPGAAPVAVPGTPPSATASTLGGPAAGIARTTIADGISKLTVTIPGAKPQDQSATGFAVTEPNKLGGPKLTPAEKFSTQAALKIQDKALTVASKTQFLHLAHDAACKIFGTTLGPEANAEHRNHFHVDMAARKVTKICD